MKINIFSIIATLFFVSLISIGQEVSRNNFQDDVAQVITKLTEKYGIEDAERINRGVRHLAELWFSKDGSGNEFHEFCMKQFIPSGPELDNALEIAEQQFEAINGYKRELSIALQYPLVTMKRPVTELDRLFNDSEIKVDFYKSKIALAIALHFSYYTNS